MKITEMKNGQVFELCENELEIRACVEKCDFTSGDESVWIEYLDGSRFSCSCGFEPEGNLSDKAIRVAIIINPYTTQVYGAFKIRNADDSNEFYSPEADDEEKSWIVDAI